MQAVAARVRGAVEGVGERGDVATRRGRRRPHAARARRCRHPGEPIARRRRGGSSAPPPPCRRRRRRPPGHRRAGRGWRSRAAPAHRSSARRRRAIARPATRRRRRAQAASRPQLSAARSRRQRGRRDLGVALQDEAEDAQPIVGARAEQRRAGARARGARRRRSARRRLPRRRRRPLAAPGPQTSASARPAQPRRPALRRRPHELRRRQCAARWRAGAGRGSCTAGAPRHVAGGRVGRGLRLQHGERGRRQEASSAIALAAGVRPRVGRSPARAAAAGASGAGSGVASRRRIHRRIFGRTRADRDVRGRKPT